jgi:hypothetical protein
MVPPKGNLSIKCPEKPQNSKMTSISNFRQKSITLTLKPSSYVHLLSYLAPFELYKDCFYIGQWKNGNKQGYGKLYFPDGSAYSGHFNKNSAKGKGRLMHSNGDVYVGDWDDDKAHGTGTYYSINGGKY